MSRFIFKNRSQSNTISPAISEPTETTIKSIQDGNLTPNLDISDQPSHFVPRFRLALIPNEAVNSTTDDVDDEEDDDEEQDDEADCDEVDEDIDYCSDQSSTTSTSSTNNPTDNTRVCDCCYCEVFGHGVPPVAPTSRNYQEMRERLRQRLSKRRAEGCDKVHRETAKDDSSNDRGGGIEPKLASGDPIATNNNTSSGNGKISGVPLVDQRNLDELLNYINGTSQKEHDKLSGKRKERQQNNNKNKGTNKNNKNINSNCKSQQQQSHKNSDQASPTRTLPNTTSTTPATNGKQKRKDKDKSTDRSTASCGNDYCDNQSHMDGQTANSKTNSKSIPSKKISTPSQQSSKNTKGHQHQHQNQNQTTKINKKANNSSNLCAKSSGDQLDSRQHRDIRHGAKSTICSRGGEFSCSPPTEDEVNFLSDDSSLSVSPEDVFKPKDIDLESGDMDELERELEAFKRFCFDSTPLVRKERVRVELKNWSSGRLQ